MSRAPKTTLGSPAAKDYLDSWNATMKLLREGKSFSGREKNCAFLNAGSDRFANVSALSGLDFDDDGRAIAATDWDHDGDVDLWFTNRTGPRLRFMRNNTNHGTSHANFVTFKLRGVQSNADAIGSRVRVLLDEDDAKPLMRTLHAGDGYLSQSSKWIHLGIPDGAAISEVEIIWPTGKSQTYADVKSGCRYLIIEGHESAKRLVHGRENVDLPSKDQKRSPVDQVARTIISSRPPIPLLKYEHFSGKTNTVTTDDIPTLLILWASWCPVCRSELAELPNMDLLANSQLKVIALSVDRLKGNDQADIELAKEIAWRFRTQIEFGFALDETIHKLRILQRIVLNQQPKLAVPMSFLIDRRGELSALYRGPISLYQLKNDIANLDVDQHSRRAAAVPFAGIWTTPPRNLLLRPVASVFREAGYQEDFDRYTKMEMSRLSRMLDSAASTDESRQLKQQFATECFNLARSLHRQGRFSSAVEYYEQGLQVWQESAEANLHLSKSLAKLKRIDEAIQCLETAVMLDPSHLEAHFDLGVHLAARRELKSAAIHFREVTRIDPRHVARWTNLGTVQVQAGMKREAAESFRAALKIDGNNVKANMNLGGVLASQGRFDQAAIAFGNAAAQQPGSAPVRAAYGKVLAVLDQPADAAREFEAAIGANPKDVDSAARLAWILATSWQPTARNGQQAVRIAVELNERSQSQNPILLDLMATAYAEAGDFEKAVTFGQQALAKTSNQQVRLKQKIKDRIKLFENRMPFHEKQKRKATN